MKSLSFRKDLIGVQEELLRFAYKLTANREEANDLLQETSLKALDNDPIPLTVISSLKISRSSLLKKP